MTISCYHCGLPVAQQGIFSADINGKKWNLKDCVGKTQPDSDRYLRIASRTETENCKLVEALIDVMDLQNGAA